MIRHPQRRKWVMITFDEFFTDFVFTNGSKWDNPGPNLNYKLTRPGSYAVYHGKLIEIIPSKKPVLLVADLDNTLVGSYQPTRDALARFNEYWIKSHYFTGSRLVYNTGRSLEEFLVLYSEGHPLLDPDLLVTAVGSDVYTVNQETGDYQLQTAYYDLFDRNHWDSEIMDRVIREEFP